MLANKMLLESRKDKIFSKLRFTARKMAISGRNMFPSRSTQASKDSSTLRAMKFNEKHIDVKGFLNEI